MIKNEEWRPVVGAHLAEFYEVSSLGRLRSRQTRKGGVKEGTILKHKKMWDGYCGFRFVDRLGNRTVQQAHRVVAKAFIPNPQNKPQVNHLDSVRDNNCIDNLEWCTPGENIQHAIKNGRFVNSLKNIGRGRNGGETTKKLKSLGYDIYPGLTKTREGKKIYMDAYNKEKYRGNI